MKSKNFILIVLVITLVSICLWWLTRPKATTPAKLAETSKPAKTAESAVSKVVAPKPFTTPVAATQTTVKSSPAPHAESIVELNADFVDIARLYRAGDTAGFMKAYTEPDKLNSELLQRVQAKQDAIQSLPAEYRAVVEDPNSLLMKMREAVAKSYEELEGQTPTFNDTGNEATYMYTMPDLGLGKKSIVQEPRTFIKIHGKWYLRSQGRLDATQNP